MIAWCHPRSPHACHRVLSLCLQPSSLDFPLLVASLVEHCPRQAPHTMTFHDVHNASAGFQSWLGGTVQSGCRHLAVCSTHAPCCCLHCNLHVPGAGNHWFGCLTCILLPKSVWGCSMATVSCQQSPWQVSPLATSHKWICNPMGNLLHA